MSMPARAITAVDKVVAYATRANRALIDFFCSIFISPDTASLAQPKSLLRAKKS
jgi:hypothetical protein